MNNVINLTPGAVKWLGSAFEKKSRISPLTTAPQEDFTQEGLDSLISQGVVTQDQTMTPEAYALLDILAGAKKFASVQLSGGSGHVNRVTYWTGDKPVSFSSKGNTFSLTPGDDVAGLEAIFNEITGSNRLISSNFSATFDYRSALAFAALFDLSRKAAIHLYADSTEVPEGFSAAEVSRFINEANNGRWLTSHLKSVSSQLKATQVDVEVSLKSMAEAGVIGAAKNGLYTLSFASAQLAAHFLFVENMVHFRSGSEKEDGSLVSVECMFLQAGLHDIIMVDFAADKVDISAISSFAMIDSLKSMMTTPPNF